MKANLSQFDRADRSLEKHQTVLDGLNRKLTIQQTITDKARITYEKMVASHGEGSKEADKAAKAFNDESAKLQGLQRSINRTTDNIKDLKDEQQKANRGWTKFGDNAAKAGDRISKVGDNLKGFGSALSASVTAPLAGGFVALTKGTEEFRTNLGRLETNALDAGIGVDSVRDSLKRLSGVSDEADSNVEALSNLLAVDFSEKGMAKTLDALSGAMIKFPDTLKIEGLADGLQETLATGKAIGPFAELLERLGYNMDDFNDGLEKAIKNGEEENYILGVLADTGLADVNEAYRKNNKELVESREASLKFQEATAELGRTLAPVMTDITEAVTDVAGAFNNLDEETQRNALIGGGVALALGPVIGSIGLVASGIGAIGTALAVISLPVAATVGTLAALGGAFYLLDKEMDKPVIKSDIFKGKISEATESAVGSYMKLDTDATAELNNLAWSSATITDEMSATMVAKYQAMGDQVLQAMKANHDEQLAEQQRLFDQSSILTEEEEAKRIAKLKADQLKEEEAHTANQERIKEIWTKASDEKRGITDAEAKEIARLQTETRLKAVEELSASQQEQETILRNLKTNKGIIEAETAANTVSKSVETRDKVVKEADKQFNETKAYAISARDELGTISSEEADKIIKEAERKRDKAVTKAQDMHTDVVGEARKQANEHADEINWETGQVLSGWDKMYNGILKASNWIKGLFGLEKDEPKGTVKETGRQTQRRQNAEFKAYAKGTDRTGHPGGAAIVGEEGRELAHIPGKGLTLLGTRGTEYHSNLPKGTSVLPNKHTEQLLKSYGFPGYAKGIGDYFDIFTKGAGSIFDAAMDKFNVSNNLIPDWSKKMTGSPLEWAKNLGMKWIDSLKEKLFGGSGGGVGGSAQAPNFGGRFRFTSGFGQRWGRLHGGVDYAAPIGTPIPSQSGGVVSFAQNGWNGGFGNLVKVRDGAYEHFYAHMSRIMTSMGQRVQKGSILGLVGNSGDSTGPHVHYELRKNGVRLNPGRVGFKTGGLVNNPGMYNLAEDGYSEWVIPTDPSRRTDAMKLLALAAKDIGSGNKRPNQLPNVSGMSNEDILVRMDEQISLMQQQLNAFMQFLAKPQQVIDSKKLTKQVSENQANDFLMFNYQT